MNSKRFQWEQGGDLNSSYDIISSNTLRITAAPETDRKINLSGNNNNKQCPLIVFPVTGDFEASVKVSFQSSTNFQRAALGLRDANDKNKEVLLYLMENYRLEALRINSGKPERLADSINHNSKVVYLKIKRQLGNVSLLYSTNGLQLSSAAPEFQFSLSNKVEIFFEVLSSHNPNTAVAEFSDFSLKQLK